MYRNKAGYEFYQKERKIFYSDTASINYHDRIHVPLRAISEALGCVVSYDEGQKM